MKLTKSQIEIIKKVVVIALVFAALVAVISIFVTFSEDDEGYKTINPAFKVGALDESTGRPVEDEKCALYTKNVIACTGIKLYADFDSDIKYVVHFYDENDSWLGCVENEGLNMTIDESMDEASELGDVYGVRIVIYPQSDENGKIGLFERGTYANQLTVKITNKEFITDDSEA